MTTPTFGVMHDFRQRLPWTVPTAEYYAECLDLVVEAETLGYDAVWLSEHHGTLDGFLASPLVVAAAIAARTRTIRIGTNVLLLPLHHPLRVAEDAAVVHALSGGRLILGIGQGYAPREFELLGVDRRHRPSRFEDGLHIIRRAWREGRTGFDGRRFTVPDWPFEPRPPHDVPIYVGATAEPSVDRAVRLADGLVVYLTRPSEVPDRYAVLTQALARHGRSRASFPFVLTGLAYVAEDADEAWAQAGPAFAYLESTLSGSVRVDDLDPRDYLVGTPGEVATRLRALHDVVPFDHFAFWARLPGLTVEQAAASQRLFAADVVPAVSV